MEPLFYNLGQERLSFRYSQGCLLKAEPPSHYWGLSRREHSPLGCTPTDLASATSSWDRMKNADIQLPLRRWHLRWEPGGEGVLCSWQHKSRGQFPPHWAGREVSESCILFYLLIYLFLAVLGLRCCMGAFSSRGEWGLLCTAVHGLLIAVAPAVAERGL